jgi:hypothetical protein
MKIVLGKGTEVDGQELITGRTLICENCKKQPSDPGDALPISTVQVPYEGRKVHPP